MNSIIIMLYMFKRMFADKKGWIGYLILPTVVLSAIVFFIGDFNQEKAPTLEVGYISHDQSPLSQLFITSLSSVENIRLVPYTDEKLKNAIMTDEIDYGFVIPEGFFNSLSQSEKPKIDYLYLSVNEQTIYIEQILQQKLSLVNRSYLDALKHAPSEQDAIKMVEQILEQQSKTSIQITKIDSNLYLNQTLFLVVGTILFFSMTIIMSSLSLVIDDRNGKTMARTYSTPVRTYEIALGYFLGTFGVGMLQILLVLIITKYIMGYEYGVSLGHLLIVFSFFIFAIVGISSALAALLKNTEVLNTVSSLVIVPTTMIGGCWWPLSIMPEFMQKLANFVPQKWAIESVTKLSAGASLTQISLQLGILLLFGIVLLGFGSYVLKPSEEVV